MGASPLRESGPAGPARGQDEIPAHNAANDGTTAIYYATDFGSLGPPPDSFVGYQVLREIHRGAQGVVYQAIQKTTNRKVAIKVMREGHFASPADIARFEREVAILAQLNHPHIVGIHDKGTACGTAYFVMDYISGNSLDEWVAAEKRSIRDTLRLFVNICEAVKAAHLRGIIHRDLKPGNIRVDQEGEPHILDFGVAKIASGTDSVPVTVTGQFMGSLKWASPEQAEAIPDKIDLRTDVYALGVTLYQMLTGTFPYSVEGSPLDVLHQIRTAEPRRPRTVRREIDDDLETIVLKCLNKERERRYETAGELARDIEHYLRGEPIEAKRDRTLYILGKHLRKYWLTLAVGAGFVFLLATGLLVSLALLGQVRQERDHIREDEALIAHALDVAKKNGALAIDREHKAQLAYAAGALDQGTALHLAERGQKSRAAFARARDALTELGEDALPAEVGLYRSYREFESPINTLVGHTDGLMAVAWFPDGVRACSASEDGTIRLWDARIGNEIRRIRGDDKSVTSLAVSADGRYILSGGHDHTIRLWNAETGSELRRFQEPVIGDVRGVALSPDGKFALSAPGALGGAVRLWDIQSGTLLRSFETPTNEAFYGVAFDAQAGRILATTYQQKIWIWDLATGQKRQQLAGHSGYVINAAFSPDGARVLSGSFDQTLRLWDTQGETCLRKFKGHAAGVRGVAFTDGGSRAVSCSMDGNLKLWDLETTETVRTFAGHTEGIRGLNLSSDGRRVISAGIDRTLRVWNLHENADAPAVREAGLVTALGCASDGLTFVSGDETGSVTLRDKSTFRVLRNFRGLVRPIETVAILAGGRRVFAADCAGEYRVWDVRSSNELSGQSVPGAVDGRNLRGEGWCFTAVSADSRLALSSKPDRTMELRNIETGAIIRTLPASHGAVISVALSNDCQYALSGDSGGEMYYWNLKDGRCLFSKHVGDKEGALDGVAFSADGKSALTCGHDLVVRLWNLNEQTKVREFAGHTLIARAAGFGSGGRTIFSCGADQTLRIWDATKGQELCLPVQLPTSAYALAVIPPGDAVLVGSGSEVSLWDLSRYKHYLDFEARVEAAGAVIRSDRDNPQALATLGEWYAFRGVYDWAVDLLVKARTGGAPVSSLMLARCYWQLNCRDGAAAEFRAAGERGEAPAEYLDLCREVAQGQAENRLSTAAAPAQTTHPGP